MYIIKWLARDFIGLYLSVEAAKSPWLKNIIQMQKDLCEVIEYQKYIIIHYMIVCVCVCVCVL